MADKTDDRELELRDYFGVLRRRKFVLVVTTLVVVGGALAASFLQTPRYRATAELLLQPRASERIFAPTQESTQYGDRKARVDTELQIMKSRSVRSAAAEVIGHPVNVDISVEADTDVVRVAATSTEPKEAADIANAYANVYIKTRRQQTIDDLLAAASEVQAKISDLDAKVAEVDNAPPEDVAGSSERQALLSQRSTFSAQLSQLQLANNLTKSGGAQLVSRAEAPTTPFAPTPLRNGLAAAVVGILLGAGLAFLRDHLDDTVRSAEALETLSGLTVLGSIPALQSWRNESKAVLAAVSNPESHSAEAYRSLRTSVQFLRLDRTLRTIQFTSALAGEGKSTTVANMAVAFGSIGQRVLVVCADLRRPRLHTFFGVDNVVGLSSVILGSVPLSDAVVPAPEIENVSVLPSGALPYNPSEFLANSRVRDVLASLADQWDVVLIDSPPIVPVSDGLVLAGEVDATILVAREGQASRRALVRALDALRLVDAPLVGAIFNGTTNLAGSESSYYGGYATASDARRTDDGREGSTSGPGRRKSRRAARVG